MIRTDTPHAPRDRERVNPTPRSNLPRGPFGVRSGSVRARVPGFVRGAFGPISDQNFRSQKFQKFSICAAVAAAAGALYSRRPEPRRREGPRRGGDGRTNRKFLNFRLRKFWPEIGPNGARLDHERIPNGSRNGFTP